MATLDLNKIGNTLSLQSPIQAATVNPPLIPTTLNSTNTAPATPIDLTPKPDNTNYGGIIAGAQTQALAQQASIVPPEVNPNPPMPGVPTQNDNIKNYIDSITGVQQPSAMTTYQQGYDASGLAQQQADINAKSKITADAQARLGNISAQLQALNTEAQAVPLQAENNAIGVTGMTGVRAQTTKQLRDIALRALPLQSEAAIVQAQVANAQNQQQLAADLYKQAEDNFNKMYQLQMTDLNNKYEFQTNLVNRVYQFADAQEQRQLQAISKQAEQDYKAQQDTIDYQRQVNLIKIRQQSTPATTSTTPDQVANLKLSTTQKSDLVDIQTLEDQLNKLQGYAADGTLEGIGSFGAGSFKSTAFSLFGTGSKEGADVRTLIGNLKGQIAKLRGGTSFTANEEKLLNSYVPGINESTASVLAKVRGLQEFLASKKNAIIQVGGGLPTSNTNDPLGIL